MAKDVVTFLSWAAEPEHDERKQYGLKAVIILSALTAMSVYVKRFKWSSIKARKIGKSATINRHIVLKCPISVQPSGGQEGSLELEPLSSSLGAPLISYTLKQIRGLQSWELKCSGKV